MNLQRLILLLAGFLLFLPTPVLSRDINVRAGNVTASTRHDGSIYINSGSTKVQVPAYNRSRWYPVGLFRLPWRTSCSDLHSSYHSNTQVSKSGQSVSQSSVYTSTCR